MKKFAILLLLALELAVCGCGSSTLADKTINTATSGNWEAQLTGGTDQASLLNFITVFDLTNAGTLDIRGFNFFNQGACFGNTVNGVAGSSETGSASFTTNTATDQVTGQLSFTVTSITPPGNVLTLTTPAGGLTGTSNGTTTTTGTLTNGIAVGSWTLTGGAGDPSCTGGGSFLMCQNPTSNGTCPPPP